MSSRSGRATSRASSPRCGRRSGSRERSSTTIPIGSGLSSSAALEVAVALALGIQGRPSTSRGSASRAEQRAVRRALRDHGPARLGRRSRGRTRCSSTAAPLDDHSDTSARGHRDRRGRLGRAPSSRRVGLRGPACRACAAGGAAHRPAARRRRSRRSGRSPTRTCARAPVTSSPRTSECTVRRERSVAARCRDAGRMMDDSHASLRDDYEVSTPALDALRRRPAGAAGSVRCPLDRGGLRWLRRRPGRTRRGARHGLGRASCQRSDSHRGVSSSPSRSSAPGVRTPHQKRSLPSTNVTGATVPSSSA